MSTSLLWPTPVERVKLCAMSEEEFQAFAEQYVAEAKANGYAHFNWEHLEDQEDAPANAQGRCTSAPLARS